MTAGDERRGFPRASKAMLRFRQAVRKNLEILLGAHVVWSFGFAGVVVLLLASQQCGNSYPRLAVGEPAPYDVRAIEDVDVPDGMATTERRAAARALVPDLYVHDTQKSATLETAFAVELDGAHPLPAAERQLLVGWLREVMQGLVIANKPMLLRQREITVLHMPAQREEVVRDFQAVVDLEAARNDVRQRVGSLATIAPSERAALSELLTSFLDANLSEDAAATAQRRDQAERAVLPVQVRVPKGRCSSRGDNG